MSTPGAATAAAAKINLFLHVLGRQPDGYHRTESLIVFADIGDRVAVTPSRRRRLQLSGPFAADLDAAGAADGNLVWRAADRFAARFGGPDWSIALEKILPVASGIGGGSADAAAVLRLLADHAGLAHDDPDLLAVAGSLGADVPVCLLSRPCLATGIGDALTPLARLAPMMAVLVNPGVAVSTAAVFQGWAMSAEANGSGSIGQFAADAFERAEDARAIAHALSATSNMLEAPARRIAPEIGVVLDLLQGRAGCLLARMSGSGATCFGLFSDQAAGLAAAAELREIRPDWWIVPTRLRGWPVTERPG